MAKILFTIFNGEEVCDDTMIVFRWWLNYGWLWVIVGGSGEVVPSCGWSWDMAANLWLVVGCRGWSHDSVMPIQYPPMYSYSISVTQIICGSK